MGSDPIFQIPAGEAIGRANCRRIDSYLTKIPLMGSDPISEMGSDPIRQTPFGGNPIRGGLGRATQPWATDLCLWGGSEPPG